MSNLSPLIEELNDLSRRIETELGKGQYTLNELQSLRSIIQRALHEGLGLDPSTAYEILSANTIKGRQIKTQ